MKGVILKINPRAFPVDISHEIEAHNVMAGALALANAYSYFPTGTIHMAVVDPGVGGARAAIIVETARGCFVGPDNGIFTLVYEREEVVNTVTIENPDFMALTVSRTFHGRDIFAPAAAYLSLGVPVDRFGRAADTRETLTLPMPQLAGDTIEGEVIHVDRFGNLITNISMDMFSRFVGEEDQTIRVAGRGVSGPYETYEEAREGEVFGIFGSSDLLEISGQRTRASETWGLSVGAVVQVTRAARGRTKG
jgi:hypothetical protein